MDWGKAFTQVLGIQNVIARRDHREPLAKSSHSADKDVKAKNEESLSQVQSQD